MTDTQTNVPIQRGDDISKPWYRRPTPVVSLVVILAALVGLGLYFLVWNDDDPSTVNILSIERVDEAGEPLDTEMLGEVKGFTDPEAFLWLEPTNGRAPEPALATRELVGNRDVQLGPDQRRRSAARMVVEDRHHRGTAARFHARVGLDRLYVAATR